MHRTHPSRPHACGESSNKCTCSRRVRRQQANRRHVSLLCAHLRHRSSARRANGRGLDHPVCIFGPSKRNSPHPPALEICRYGGRVSNLKVALDKEDVILPPCGWSANLRCSLSAPLCISACPSFLFLEVYILLPLCWMAIMLPSRCPQQPPTAHMPNSPRRICAVGAICCWG